MGTQEIVAHSRESQRQAYLDAAAQIHAITPRLRERKAREENEAEAARMEASAKEIEEELAEKAKALEAAAKRVENIAAEIAVNEVHDHARGIA